MRGLFMNRWQHFCSIMWPVNLLLATVNAVVYGDGWLAALGVVAAGVAWVEVRASDPRSTFSIVQTASFLSSRLRRQHQ